MNYTENQIRKAKAAYDAMLKYRSVSDYDPEFVGYSTAQQRCEHHNNIVREILAGNKQLEKKWKLFFLQEEVKSSRKEEERKLKLDANKAASADILEPIKKMRKLGEFGKWLNTKNNPYRKQHFSKKYTKEAVEAFLSI